MIKNNIDYKTRIEKSIASYRRRTQSTVAFKAALIDMDGTLYDSMPNHARAWKKMCDEVGLDCNEKEFFHFEGMTGKQTVCELFKRNNRPLPDDEYCELLYKIKSRYFNTMRKVSVMPGAAEMVEKLKELDITRVVVTGSGQRSLIERIMHDFPGIFSPDRLITSHDVKSGKPSPEPYLKAMELIGEPSEACVVIENAPLGVISGHRSGAYVVGVSTGPIPEVELAASGADIVFSSMEMLAANIDYIFKDTEYNRQ